MAQVQIEIGEKVRHRHAFEDWQEVFIPPDVVGDQEKMLLAANDLLVKTRPYGVDHERKDEVFLTAALVKTTQGRFFVSPNLQLANAPTSRNCGELRAVSDGVEKEGQSTMEIADLWFMGGRAIVSAPGPENIIKLIKEGDEGIRPIPCGSCLDVIWGNRRSRIPGSTGPQTQIHILPLNDGNLVANGWGGKLIPYDGRDVTTTRLEPNQVLTKEIGELLPYVSVSLADPNGNFKETMKAGWDILTHNSTMKALSRALHPDAMKQLNSLKGKSPDEVKTVINEILVNAMTDLVGLSSTPVHHARVVIARTDSGEYFLGESLENGRASGMQFAEFDAIDRMLTRNNTGARVTDIFIYAVDFEQVQQLRKTWHDEDIRYHPKAKPESWYSGDDDVRTNMYEHTRGRLPDPGERPMSHIPIPMPDGATRRRISAVSPTNGDELFSLDGDLLNKESGCNVHVVLANNKTNFDPRKHIISMPLSKLLPFRWVSPSMAAHESRTASCNAGCSHHTAA